MNHAIGPDDVLDPFAPAPSDGLLVPDWAQERDLDGVLTPSFDAPQRPARPKRRRHRHRQKKHVDTSLDAMIAATTAKFGEDRAAYDHFVQYAE